MQGAKPGDRITLKITRNNSIQGQAVTDNQIPNYFGLRTISQTTSLRQTIEDDYDLRIATSRLGTPVNQLTGQLSKVLTTSKKTLILFGPPSEGLNQIAAREGFNLNEKVNFTINTVPDQGTATVRTEEALSATLTLINYLTHLP
jgi:methyltransferase